MKHLFRRIRPQFTTLLFLTGLFCSLLLAQQTLAQGKGQEKEQAGKAVGMVSPSRIAEGPAGRLLVSDYAAEAVFVVDKGTLQIEWVIDIKGKPMGIAGWGNLMFVGNQETQSVEVYEIDVVQQRVRLSYSLGAGSGKKNPGILQRPTDIAIDPVMQQVFVLDIGDQTVKVFDVSGNLVTTFVPAVTGQPVTFVAAIALDVNRKELHVSDHGVPYGGTFSSTSSVPPRLLVFDYAGNYLRMVNGDGMFNRPQGLTLDDGRNIFMVDPVLGEMLVFNQASGIIVKRFAELRGATDVLLDLASGDLFVVDNKLARIQDFRGEGRIP